MPGKLKIYSFTITYHDGRTEQAREWNNLYERNRVMKKYEIRPEVKSCKKTMRDL